jgi:hypothetical protein
MSPTNTRIAPSRVLTQLSPASRHANKIQAKRFADRLLTLAANNPADVVHEWAANEVGMLLDAASRRTPASTVSDASHIRDVVLQLVHVRNARDFQTVATAILLGNLRRGLECLVVGTCLLAFAMSGSAHAADAECLAGAAKLALATGSTIDRVTEADIVVMRNPAAEGFTYGCPPEPNVSIFWNGIVPSPATVDLIIVAGNFITGIPAARIKQELSRCIAAALKSELGAANFLGTEFGCDASTRSGGFGSVEIDTPKRAVRP